MTESVSASKEATEFAWTEQAIARMRELRENNHSASAIAHELSTLLGSPVTRNMVLGKLHRLGVKRAERPETALPEPAPQQEPEPILPIMGLPFAAPAHPIRPVRPNPGMPGISLPDIGLFQCRWPLNEPSSPDFRFCGEPCDPVASYSWCPAHMAIGVDRRSRDQTRRDRDKATTMRNGRAIRAA